MIFRGMERFPLARLCRDPPPRTNTTIQPAEESRIHHFFMNQEKPPLSQGDFASVHRARWIGEGRFSEQPAILDIVKQSGFVLGLGGVGNGLAR
jgi:hypothetical protein